ncbi:PEP-CTERM/exosortase system-associated acyltransferase [Aliiglaciecola sp. LCG003]|uniref:PEP-CTERM/exosortase system-associated acyltransferase n=1 Tax=Aliiglaciecola sp. LCG003 TaxID=3053655 RepID=UPI002573CC08|nr:PEP-CTERM/exosortase system-associated acyltransferase [Aliiglaciecola sp. LCG003]WJG08462.1 PEP-CTERM/exosortase system-associated acyltransferase [Aliiglaciecola sp. LCG003]
MTEISEESISSHFSDYLRPVFSETQQHKNQSFEIRHQVYCEELHFEPERDDRLETDEFDKHALHCLIQHKSSELFAGTVRLIVSDNPSQLLPIELYCKEAIQRPDLFPDNFARNDICEISRLAVPAQFRRRKMDNYEGAAIGMINKEIYSETELRCFPFIAVGLYLSATSILLKKNINHCFVMVEPRLARSMRFVGLPFEQIGPVIDYHGKRAPYYIQPKQVEQNLKQDFKALLQNIDIELQPQI